MRSGSDIRQENRNKQRDAIRTYAEKHASKAFSDLPDKITQQEFDDAWQKVDVCIEKKAASSTLYELGFNTALSIAIRFIEEQQWRVNACYHFIRIERETAFRDESWTSYAFELYDVHESWMSDINDNGLAKSGDTALADFFLSLIFHSGVCDAGRLLGVLKTIADKPRVSTFNQLPYLSYVIPKEHVKTTNYIDEKGYCQHTGMCFLSAPTLALLNHLFKQKNWVAPQDLSDLYAKLKERCDYQLTKTKLKSAIFVTENLVRLTQPEVNMSVGNISSFSLPENQFVELVYQPVDCRALSDFYTMPANHPTKRGKRGRAINSDTDIYKDMSEVLRKASKQKSATSNKNRAHVIEQFQALLDNDTSANESILIRWLMSLLERKQAISSIQRYQSAIGKAWLALTENEDLFSYSPAEFELLYAEIADDISSLKERTYASGRLGDLHRFCVREFAFPRLNEAVFSGYRANSVPHVRAGVINEVLFSQLLNAISTLQHTNQDTIDTIKAMVIVAFRCGLRIGEIVKLRTKDVVVDIDTTRLYVAPNEDGKNKSESSNRLVPLSLMLLPEEKSLIDAHMKKRVNTKLLFSLPDNPNRVPPNQLISNLVIYYLRTISGDKHYVFHHLRHSCMSRLQLLLYDETNSTLPLFMPYDVSQAKLIKQDIWRKNDKIEYALAKFAGHESPETTYASYYHFTEYGIGKKLATLVLTKSKLSKKCESMEKLLARCPKTKHLNEPSIKHLPDELINENKTDKSKERIPLAIIYDLLNQYHAGEDVEAKLLLYGCDRKQFDKWYNTALKIKTGSLTRYGNSALFSPERQGDILPAQPQSHQEQALIERLIIQFRKQYAENKEDFEFVLLHTLKHSSSTNSGVMFYKPQDLARYVNTLALLRVKSNLRAMTHRANSPEWLQALKGVNIVPKNAESEMQTNQRHCKGSVRVQLVHPDEARILSNQSHDTPRTRYSSNLLVYLFHISAILLWRGR